MQNHQSEEVSIFIRIMAFYTPTWDHAYYESLTLISIIIMYIITFMSYLIMKEYPNFRDG